MYLSCHSIFEVVDMFQIWISALIIAWKTKNMSMCTLALTSQSHVVVVSRDIRSACKSWVGQEIVQRDPKAKKYENGSISVFMALVQGWMNAWVPALSKAVFLSRFWLLQALRQDKISSSNVLGA